MKNRKLTILIVLVAIIWGTIGFKIYEKFSEEPVSVITPAKFVVDTVSQEHYDLSLSYNDPFLKTPHVVREKVKSTEKRNVTAPKNVVPEVVVNWDQIKYIGSIHNSSRKIVTANVKIGTTDYLMKEGETMEGFLLLKIQRDSVQFSYGKVNKYIKREKLK